MNAFVPKVGNPIPMTNDHIIDFVRSRNHPSKHLDLFPNDIASIINTGYGRVTLDTKTYVFDIINEQDVNVLRIMLGNPDIDERMPVINTFVIDPSRAYSMWTMSCQNNIHIYIGSLEVPTDLVSATAWALGLVAKNRVTPYQLINLYHINQDEYERKHDKDPSLPEGAFKPCIKKFTDWLAGTWVADRNGSTLNAKVTWSTNTDVYPSYDEAIDALDGFISTVITASARSRITYVKSVLEKRKENNGES